MRSRSRRPPSALMLMGCNEAKTAPPPSQQMLMGCHSAPPPSQPPSRARHSAPPPSQPPSRARHSAHHHQELPGALRGTRWRAHRSALRSLRKRDGAAENARRRWTSLSPSRRRAPQSVRGGPKSPSPATALPQYGGPGTLVSVGRSRRVCHGARVI